MEYRYYIAYGSNINKNQMAQRCPNSRIIGKGFLNDYELLFKGPKDRIYLTIEKCPGSRIPVLVWLTSFFDEKALDIYEDYPNLYYKDNIKIDVKKEDSDKAQPIKAYVYKMHEGFNLGLPTKSYYEACIKGYEDMGFDKSILESALNKSKDILDK